MSVGEQAANLSVGSINETRTLTAGTDCRVIFSFRVPFAQPNRRIG
jgi:hypothetical protein